MQVNSTYIDLATLWGWKLVFHLSLRRRKGPNATLILRDCLPIHIWNSFYKIPLRRDCISKASSAPEVKTKQNKEITNLLCLVSSFMYPFFFLKKCSFHEVYRGSLNLEIKDDGLSFASHKGKLKSPLRFHLDGHWWISFRSEPKKDHCLWRLYCNMYYNV